MSAPPEAGITELAADLRATHEDLSPEAARFLDYARSDPEAARPIDRTNMPELVRQFKYPFQAWPTLVGGRKLAELERVTLGVTGLVKSVFARIFDNDPRRIAEHYRLSEFLATLLLERPNGIAGAIARCDFFDSGQGLKCLEVNLGAGLGGWQTGYWGDAFCKIPSVARFLAAQQVTAVTRDPLRSLLRHIVDDSLSREIGSGGEINVALAVNDDDLEDLRHVENHLRANYAMVLEQDRRGLAGTLVMTSFERGLAARNGLLYHGGLPIHAVVEYTDTPAPPDVYRCFKADRLSLYNGPLSGMLTDKRNLALLSQHEESDVFDAAERALIREHIPWGREASCGRVTWRGESALLADLLLARREDFVIKPANGYQGDDVYVGRFTAPEVWRRQVSRVTAERGWLAQEFVDSRPYLYQWGDSGWARHRVVWGLFCFGSRYGGGFLRMVPAGSGDGVINAARGATEGLIFEVQPPAAAPARGRWPGRG